MVHQREFVVNSGQTVSEVVALKNFSAIAGLVAPVITSCAVFVQAAVASAGPFTRLINAAGSGDLTWAVGAGSRSWVPADGVTAFRFARLEMSVAQTDIRTFTALIRL